ncbi:TetR family transcriptional regulator [Izhakiella australiensis]|uniref:TetR family transcriptional regulator n=1 Tax=Izhakiella australiensis TaxID=1926881 RepID=A0A1S8YP44_9GAMM|nr:TetR/AcrR family transcriptional regulator [Izhakiella australiensis]OON40587.1 TetR family transcriptional regulator [Izhakiella australiensis]
MTQSTPAHLTPRKRPRQARAKATLEAIFQATTQVLIAEGPYRLTTTRVAERAGVSIGSMYQYFPHKQALFYALNENYLDALAGRITAACQAQSGASIEQMVAALVNAYWQAKMERPEVTRALYRSVAELDNQALIASFAARVDAAALTMFASANDASFADLTAVNLTLIHCVFGTVRSVFERNLPPQEALTIRDHLMMMCVAYLRSVSDRSPVYNTQK